MCGIIGFFSTIPQSANIIERMANIIRHRGPDDEGFVLFSKLSAIPRVCGGNDTPDDAYQVATGYAPKGRLSDIGDYPITLALGHRRLSIVDLSPFGHQPMNSVNGRYWIVFNGEIYNHIELRAELEKNGYQFVSHTDTEVIIAAYDYWGKDCLNRFNGMFAFLLYDMKQCTLFGVRDRFGIKPFYYWVTENSIVFASEIKQFKAVPQWCAKINGQRVYDFLNWGITDHTDETLFAGVFQLRSGQAFELDLQAIIDGKVQYAADNKLPIIYSWYQLKPKPFIGTMKEASEQFNKKLTESVKLHLRADVSIGSCLSGGLDSSSIVCLINQLLREQGSNSLQKTFSFCSNEKKNDERKWIDAVVDTIDVDAYYFYPVITNLFTEMPIITWHQDEPFASTSIYAQWNVFRLAAERQVKVMLDGQGADEQLAGYHCYFGLRLVTLFKSLRWITLLKEATAMRNVHGYTNKKIAKLLFSNLLPTQVKNKLRSQPDWLNFNNLKCIAANPFIVAGAAVAKTTQNLSISHLTASNLQMLLHWEDRDSMGHSIESRVPFLDHRIVEFVIGLPDEYKLSEGVTKRVLRQGMNGIIPCVIRDRMDKLGFVTPEETWLKRNPDLFREKLKEAILVSRGILHKNESENMLEKMIMGKLPFSSLPWRLINFGEWIKQFDVKI